jgi:dGTPase
MVKNDHITHRVLHVQLVSKIARTVGRFLGLNEDLIEAIALGHDLGHPPFGHDGENILSDLCRINKIGNFLHNVQSVLFLDRIEKNGLGLNLTLQVLDGILCHDGEIHSCQLSPEPLGDFNTLDRKISVKMNHPDTPLIPMTFEGCVVRICDTIAYIGRDIEDAIQLNLIRRTDIPSGCTEILGKTNGTIVYKLVTDLIENSYGRQHISFSKEVSTALAELKQFNYRKIYLNPFIKEGLDKIHTCYSALFKHYLEQMDKQDLSSVIYKDFADKMNDSVKSQVTSPALNAEKVRDFLAGMTDDYFLSQAQMIGCTVPKKK